MKGFAPSARDSAELPKSQQITVMNYDSDVTRIKNRINLDQNLFSFLLEGEKSVHYAGKYVSIKPNQFLLLSAGNCLMSEKIASDAGRYRSILIFFDNAVLADFFIRHPYIIASPVAHEDAFLMFEKDPFLINYTNSLGHILEAGQSLSPRIQKVKLEELLLYLSDKYPGHIQKLRTMGQRAADELVIHQAITANLDNPVSVEELAFLCHVSLSTFKRRFAKIYGTSPNKWLLNKRMQRAADLLKQKDVNASEIYYELGYENLSSFVQSFKQIYGITPKQFQLSK